LSPLNSTSTHIRISLDDVHKVHLFLEAVSHHLHVVLVLFDELIPLSVVRTNKHAQLLEYMCAYTQSAYEWPLSDYIRCCSCRYIATVNGATSSLQTRWGAALFQTLLPLAGTKT